MAIDIENILSETTRLSMQSMAGSMTEVNVLIREQSTLIDELESNLQSVEIAYRQVNVAANKQEETVETFHMLRTEISDLKAELGKLEDSYKNAAKEGKELDGVKDSISSVSGAMDVAINTAALLGVEQERLTMIQTKLKNLMGIVSGLQQVINTVNSQGAASTSMLAGAQNLFAGATARLTVALGGSAVAAKILMASLTMGLSVAITAVMALWNRYSESQEQIKKGKERMAAQAREQAKAEDKQRESAADTVTSQLVEYKKLQAAYRDLGSDLKRKEQFVNDNQGAFNKLGIAVSGVTDAERLLVKGEDAFLQTIANRALMAASMEVAADKYREAIKVMMQAESYEATDKDRALAKQEADKDIVPIIDEYESVKRRPWVKDLITTSAGENSTEEDVIKLRKIYSDLYENKLAGQVLAQKMLLNADSSKPMEDAFKALMIQNKLKNKNGDIFKKFGLEAIKESGGGNRNKGTKAENNADYLKEIATGEFNVIAKAQEQILEIKGEGYNKQRAQAELNYQKELREIEEQQTKIRDAYKEASKEAEKTGKPIDKETQQQYESSELYTKKRKENAKQIRDKDLKSISQKEAKEKEDAFNALIAPLQNYEVQLEGLQKKYEETEEKLKESKSDVQRQKVGAELESLYSSGGLKLNDGRWGKNEKLNEELKQKGWDTQYGNGVIPLQQISIQRKLKEDSDETETVEILVTPVTKDGVVLDEKGFKEYVRKTLGGNLDLSKADKDGILVSTNVDIAGVDLAAIASKQKEYYDLQNDIVGNSKKDEQVNAALEQLAKVKVEDENSLALIFAQKDAIFQAFVENIIGWSIEEIDKNLKIAEDSLADMTKTGNATPEELAVAKGKIVSLRNQLDKLKAKEQVEGKDTGQDKWKKTAATIKKCRSEIENLIGSMDFLDETTKSALQAASNVGDGAMAMIDGIQKLGKGAGDTVKGVEKASVILAIVGAAIKIMTAIFSMASGAEKRHQKALEEIASSKLAMQREYNLLLLEQNLLMKEATTVFGEKEIAKAANAIDVYRKAISEYNKNLVGEAPVLRINPFNKKASMDAYGKELEMYEKGLGALNNITIKTGHKKTGFLGWGKGKDIYSSVLSVYPDLIDGENRLNVERAKSIINTQTMSDENKNLLQYLVDLQEKADEAQEALRGYLEETFGSLGDGIMDSITAAILDDGVDAWELFGEKGAEVLQDLGRQLVYSLFFADKFAQLQKKLEAVYGSGKSETEIAKDAMAVVGEFYNEVGGQMDAAKAFMESWQSQAKEYGFDLWESEDSSQSGRAGSFTSMTQDQGTKLEGLFTSLQDHTSSIDYAVLDIRRTMYAASDQLSEIARNTAYCVHLEQMAGDISELKRDGIKMK